MSLIVIYAIIIWLNLALIVDDSIVSEIIQYDCTMMACVACVYVQITSISLKVRSAYEEEYQYSL